LSANATSVVITSMFVMSVGVDGLVVLSGSANHKRVIYHSVKRRIFNILNKHIREPFSDWNITILDKNNRDLLRWERRCWWIQDNYHSPHGSRPRPRFLRTLSLARAASRLLQSIHASRQRSWTSRCFFSLCSYSNSSVHYSFWIDQMGRILSLQVIPSGP